MQQLRLLPGSGNFRAELAECRSCTTTGRWSYADCGQCRKEQKRLAQRRWFTHCGLDRAGKVPHEARADR